MTGRCVEQLFELAARHGEDVGERYEAALEPGGRLLRKYLLGRHCAHVPNEHRERTGSEVHHVGTSTPYACRNVSPFPFPLPSTLTRRSRRNSGFSQNASENAARS